MQAPWNFSSTFLPCTGEPIDFMIDDRNQPIHGTFLDGVFHSRWADYRADRVRSWRGSQDGLSMAALQEPEAAPTGTFLATWRGLVRAVFPGSDTSRIAPQLSHARKPAVPAA